MKEATFKNQLILGIIIIVIGNICAFITKQGVLCNISWGLYGLLFLVNPVCPEKAKSVKHVKLYFRLAGLFIIILAFLIRFVY